jgi:hypothetical protein
MKTYKTSSVQRSLKYLRDNGWTACVVEKWIPPRGKMKFGVRIDAFGFGDILACSSDELRPEIALVQTSALSERQRHKDKTNALDGFYAWKASGGIVLLHSWRKLKPHGKRATWEVIEERL